MSDLIDIPGADFAVGLDALNIPSGTEVNTSRKLPPMRTTLDAAEANGWITSVTADDDAVRLTVSWPMEEVVVEAKRVHARTSVRQPSIIRMTVVWHWVHSEQAYRWKCNDQAGWGRGCDAVVLTRESDTVVTADPHRIDRRISLKATPTAGVVAFTKLLADHGPDKVAHTSDDAVSDAASPWRQVVRENVSALVVESTTLLDRYNAEVRESVDKAIATSTALPAHPERDEMVALLTALATGSEAEGMDETGEVRHVEDALVLAAEALLRERHAGVVLLDLIARSGLRLTIEHG